MTLKIKGQGHNENRPKFDQVIYGSGPSILPEINENCKIVWKLSDQKNLRAVAAADAAVLDMVAYEPAQKFEVTTSIPVWLNQVIIWTSAGLLNWEWISEKFW